MIFDLFGTERRKLKTENVNLQLALIDSQEYGVEANRRLGEWVKKHDEVLLKYKALKQKYGEKDD